MEKSGQRFTHFSKIIDQPKLKSPWRYFIEGSITMGFWVIGVYWLAPVITVLLWFVGIQLFYQKIFPQGGVWEFIELFKRAGLLFLLLTAVLLSWTYYNYLWFLKRGERRNKKVTICHDEDFADFFGIDVEQLKKAKKSSQVMVELKDKRIIINPL
jgi:poly-beta-1,6-N-acetyl-D-glucosamine biosynthesis protein PgaD